MHWAVALSTLAWLVGGAVVQVDETQEEAVPNIVPARLLTVLGALTAPAAALSLAHPGGHAAVRLPNLPHARAPAQVRMVGGPDMEGPGTEEEQLGLGSRMWNARVAAGARRDAADAIILDLTKKVRAATAPDSLVKLVEDRISAAQTARKEATMAQSAAQIAEDQSAKSWQELELIVTAAAAAKVARNEAKLQAREAGEKYTRAMQSAELLEDDLPERQAAARAAWASLQEQGQGSASLSGETDLMASWKAAEAAVQDAQASVDLAHEEVDAAERSFAATEEVLAAKTAAASEAQSREAAAQAARASAAAEAAQVAADAAWDTVETTLSEARAAWNAVCDSMQARKKEEEFRAKQEQQLAEARATVERLNEAREKMDAISIADAVAELEKTSDTVNAGNSAAEASVAASVTEDQPDRAPLIRDAVGPADAVTPILDRLSLDRAVQYTAEHPNSMAVVKFYAPWCRACRAMKARFEKLAEENPEHKFLEVSVASAKKLVTDLGVENIPSVQIYSAGELRWSDRVGKTKWGSFAKDFLAEKEEAEQRDPTPIAGAAPASAQRAGGPAPVVTDEDFDMDSGELAW